MRKFAVTRKALRVYAAYNPKYFPLMFLQAIFNNLAPYFNLWMSAEIVTSLYEARGKEEIYRMVLITLFGNLIIRVLGAGLTKAVNTQLEMKSIFRIREAFHRMGIFVQACMSLFYVYYHKT